MSTLALVTVGAALLCAVSAVAGAYVYTSGKAQHEQLVERLSQAELPPGTAQRRRSFSAVDRRLRATRLGRRIERRLASTGLDLTPGEFFVYMVALSAVLWIAGDYLLAPLFGPVAAGVGVWASYAYLGWQQRRRTEEFIGQLPELARTIANATHAGLALRTALEMAAEELEAPAGEELRRVADELAVGRSVEDALGELAQRLPSRELGVLVSTLVLSNKAGGSVVESLRNLTQTLEERKETRREVRTQLSQVNATAFIIPTMGLLFLLAMSRIWPGVLEKMTTSPLGIGALCFSLFLYALGFVLIRRLGKIEV